MRQKDSLYGRTPERTAIAEVLTSAAKGEGRALVVRGEAGIGKSALLEYASAEAGPMRVLRATGAESETGLAFAALHQLLHPVTGGLDALPAPQRDAVAGALGLAATRSDDRFLVSAGVLSLLIEAAADDGLLVVVDDFQWIDQASADALLFSARRLGSERVAMLLAVRGEARTPGLPELALTGLDQESATALLAERAAPAQEVGARLAELTGGNPLALRETVELLTADQLAGRAALPEPLPVGAGIFGEQVRQLPGDTRRLLLAAALESGGELGLVLDVAGVGAESLRPAENAGLVTVGSAIRFRHPLVRSAVHASADPAYRREVHEALAARVRDPTGARGTGRRRPWARTRRSPPSWPPRPSAPGSAEGTPTRPRRWCGRPS